MAGFVCLVATGCFGRSLSVPPPDPTPMDREPYTIGVTDVLKISVWKNPELSVEVPVRADGMISVPLVDDVQAEGLTPPELKEVITRELAEYVTAPDVTVIVLAMNSRFVSVIGEVMQDTRVPLTRDLRVLEAIASAGGFGTFADKGDVRIVRHNPDGTESEYRFDYNAYIRGRAPGTNIVLQHGDTIIVPD
jgi:polysaccharide biosynthesis/export protein